MTKEKTIEILNAILNYVSIGRKEFSNKIGINNPQWIADALNPQKKVGISKDKAERICNAYPEINLSFVMSGEGEMLNNSTGYKIDEIAIPTTEELQELSYKEVYWVPLIPSAALANSLVEYTSNSVFLKDCPKTISPVLGAQYAIPISGDSMEPEYHNGTIAYIKAINSSAFIPWGHTVILDTENGAFIKKIYPDSDDPEYVWARSINPAYPPMHIPVSSIYRLFRVLGTSRIFTTM